MKNTDKVDIGILTALLVVGIIFGLIVYFTSPRVSSPNYMPFQQITHVIGITH